MTMKSLKVLTPLALVVALAAGHAALASESDADLDARFRAKLMKEKSKMNAEQTTQDLKDRRAGAAVSPEGDCGSQNIGNVNTNGRPGAAPREIFVFAPNAINIVNSRGCGN
jgi:hypothetical protein